MYTEDIDFPFLRFLFECRVSGPLLYFTSRRGETIKGLISREMKKLFPCPSKTSCDRCKTINHPGSCEYVRFFRYDLAQRPFNYTIIPPLNPRSIYHQNEKFSFEIRLFGECARLDYLIKYLAPAIEQGGLLTGIGTWYKEKEQHFGRFQLSGVYVWQNKAWTKVFQEETGFIEDDITPQSFQGELGQNNQTYNEILFYTPFCLKRNKKILPEPSLEDIVYFSIMRLRSIYGDRTIKISEDAYAGLEAIEATSFSFEQIFSAKNLSYFIGRMHFEKINPELLPILKLGSFCNIGKGTTQGYGGYFLLPPKS
jgi:hypothetical protein